MPTRIESITATEYDAARRLYMGSHSLESFIRSPRRFQLEAKGLVKAADSSAYAFGRAFHCWLLEGESTFLSRYLVSDGPINEKTGNPYGRDTKAFQAWLAEQTCELVTGEEFARIQGMAASVVETVGTSIFLGHGEPEVTIRGQMMGVDCQSRLDWLDVGTKTFCDVKTCANLEDFERSFAKYAYGRQLAFYREMLRELGQGSDWRVYVLAIEKDEPFRGQMYQVMDSTLLVAREEVLRGLEQYRAVFSEFGDAVWPISFQFGRSVRAI